MEHTQDTGHPEPHARPEFEILINEHEVVVHDHRITGLEIKRTAIAQNVPIQLDFVLSAGFGDRDQPDRSIVIAEIGDRDRNAATLAVRS